MSLLTIEAYCVLLQFDYFLSRGDFAALYNKVRGCPRKNTVAPAPAMVEAVCAAMDMACIWYWKEARCLQRAAATACLLRRHGLPARLVIGTQQMPLRAHAWVEVDGRVVNDRPYMREMYAVLDEC